MHTHFFSKKDWIYSITIIIKIKTRGQILAIVTSQLDMSQLQKDASFTAENNVCIYYNFQTFWNWDTRRWDMTSIIFLPLILSSSFAASTIILKFRFAFYKEVSLAVIK